MYTFFLYRQKFDKSEKKKISEPNFSHEAKKEKNVS